MPTDPRSSRQRRDALLARIPRSGTTPHDVLRDVFEAMPQLTEEDLRDLLVAIGRAHLRETSDVVGREPAQEARQDPEGENRPRRR